MASYDIQSHAQPHVKTPESVHGIRRQLGARFVLKDPKARNYVMSGLHPLRVTLVAHVKRLWACQQFRSRGESLHLIGPQDTPYSGFGINNHGAAVAHV